VSIILRETTNAGHSTEFAGLFKAMHATELGNSVGQVAITSRLLHIDHNVVRTVHWSEQKLVTVLHLNRWKLTVGIVRIVSRGFEQFDVAEHRRADLLVSSLDEFLRNEVFELPTYSRTFRQPENKTLPYSGINRKEFMLFAENPMISLFRFFELREIGSQFFLVEKGGRIEPLELLFGRISFPLGTGNAH
jgi:hypothetical protein